MARSASTRRPAPTWDPVFTVGLLVIGLFQVTQQVAQARDFRGVLDTVVQQAGAGGSYPREDVATTTGWIVMGTEVLCLVLAIGFAVPRIRSRRWAFWVPVVCALVSAVVTTLLTVGALAMDPVFVSRLMRTG